MQSSIAISVFCLTCVSSALAERAWEGHIRLLDSNVMMVFDGYEHGTWDDVGRLEFPARGRASSGTWSVAFRITPDDDDPLQATIHGSIELVVDEQKAVIPELRFVRQQQQQQQQQQQHANWQIDPGIVAELKKTAQRHQQGESQSDHVERKKQEASEHSSPDAADASRGSASTTLLDADLPQMKLAEALDRGWELERVSLSDKGLFLNGRYEFGDNGYRAVFPVDELEYSRFSFSIDFQGLDFNPERKTSPVWLARALGNPGTDPHTNLITGGTSYRWFNIKIRDEHLWLTLNNGDIEHPYINAVVTPRQWHTVSGSIDLAAGVIHLMLDGELVATEMLPKEFSFAVVGSTADASDRQLTFTDYSNSESFHGYVARVTVLGNSLSERELREWYQSGAEYRSHLRQPVRWETTRMLNLAILIVFVVGVGLWWRLRKEKEKHHPNTVAMAE